MIKKLNIPDPVYFNNTDGKFLYVRHGKTFYNIEFEKLGSDKTIKTDPKFIDCELSPEGIKQAREKQSIFNSFKIEDIYVSPLYRTLQTAYYLFETHPNKKNITIYVHPLISENVNATHDITIDIKKSKKKFNENSEIKYDWNIFESYYKTEKEQDLYYLNFIDLLDEKEKNNIINKIYLNYGTDNLKNCLSEMVELENKFNLYFLESYKHIFYRNYQFKEFLREKYKNSLNNKDMKVVIISHGGYCKIGTSKKAYEIEKIDKLPEDCYFFKNCEIVSMNI